MGPLSGAGALGRAPQRIGVVEKTDDRAIGLCGDGFDVQTTVLLA